MQLCKGGVFVFFFLFSPISKVFLNLSFFPKTIAFLQGGEGQYIENPNADGLPKDYMVKEEK